MVFRLLRKQTISWLQSSAEESARQLRSNLDDWVRSLSRLSPVVRQQLIVEAREELDRHYHIETFEDRAVRFSCPTKLTLTRAQSLLTKEPGTISWINSFSPGQTMWDIGANVGVYSLYAALSRQCRVFSFEPAASNYAALNENIRINGLGEQISAYCICIADKASSDILYLSNTSVGAALHNYGSNVDFKGDRFPAAFQQGSLAFPIDYLVEELKVPFPDHIKIDVDGLESSVVTGGRQTLCDRRVRSVLVEVESNDGAKMDFICGRLTDSGLRQDTEVAGNLPRHVKGSDVVIQNVVFRR